MRMPGIFQCAVAAGLLLGSGLPASASETITETETKQWLTDAPDEATRLQRLERYLRGFDQPMWEVGDRFERIQQALSDENWPLADYHWNKIKTTIEMGLMKRPARRESAERLFLGEPWEALSTALKSGNPERIEQAYETAKSACMACHAAEDVPFMNEQPLFLDDGFDHGR